MIYRLQTVTKQFGKSVVLKNVTVDIDQGERVVLLGPSGSGKTTLFRLLNVSIFPSSGQLMYRGSDVVGMSGAQLRAMRRQIGSVYQQHYLVAEASVLMNTLSGALGQWSFARSLHNLVTPKSVDLDRAEECLKAVGLQDKMRVRCDQLSGGQQQRLAIARTLMQGPEVILADEPVASLDPALAEDILNLLVKLADERGHALLISLHQVEFARRYAKRIVALRDGEIAFDVPASELTPDSLDQLYRGRAQELHT